MRVWTGFRSHELPLHVASFGFSESVIKIYRFCIVDAIIYIYSFSHTRFLYVPLLMCRSLVRRSLGCESLSWDYQEKGVVATLHLASAPPANTTAFQRFLPSGPVGRLPTVFLVLFNLLIFSALTALTDHLGGGSRVGSFDPY